MKGINGLGHYAAIALRDALDLAIKKQECSIENCGSLTHQDSKQAAASKDYFTKQLELHKHAIQELHRFRAEVSQRVWDAYNEATDQEG